jgi:hypothetical protein
VGTEDFPPGVKKLEHDPDHLFQSNVEISNLSTFTFTATICVRSVVIGTEKIYASGILIKTKVMLYSEPSNICDNS